MKKSWIIFIIIVLIISVISIVFVTKNIKENDSINTNIYEIRHEQLDKSDQEVVAKGYLVYKTESCGFGMDPSIPAAPCAGDSGSIILSDEITFEKLVEDIKDNEILIYNVDDSITNDETIKIGEYYEVRCKLNQYNTYNSFPAIEYIGLLRGVQ